ncbi:tetratricopeptide repeat protein [Desulfobulbus elongatus]|uniref:tetratricopeptide repeat protein n=1 Tax=Desulfobulbus elongatus TaxID=53332 RepID=UPI00047F10C2|nr:tetratricopeptide repeat protein [Desulfobulbus elongatus]
MNGSVLGALVAAALIVAYLLWKKWAAPKQSETRPEADAVPVAEAGEETVEPAAVLEEEPVQVAADAVEPDAEALAQPQATGVDEPESIDLASAPVLAERDEALEIATPATDKAAEAEPAIVETAEQEPVEREPPEPVAAEPAVEASGVDDSQADPISAASAAPVVRLTLEAYSARMNNLEDRQRALLARAIADQDDGLRDRLQRELVIMNDKLALIADSYVEEVACLQQVLETLVLVREELGELPDLATAIDCLRDGDAGPAEACLAELSDHPHPLAGRMAFARGQLAECRVDLQQALAQYRQAVTLAPDEPRFLHAAGRTARTLYKYKEAVPWLESFVHLSRQQGDRDPLALALAQRELAYTHVLAGQYQKAGPLYKESMTAMARKLGPDHAEMATCWFQIGELQETLGEYDKAVSLYKKALDILERKKGPEHPALAAILAKLAALCMELEMEAEAVPLYERLVRIREKALRPNHPQLAISLNSLAESYRLRGRYGEAEACYLKILAINEAMHGPDHPGVAAVLQELAKLNTNLRKPEVARQYQDRAAAIFQRSVEASEQKGGKEALTLEL